MSNSGGQKLLRELRRRARVRRREHDQIWGELRFRWQGRIAVLNLHSPHAWDVRLWRGAPAPRLSYEVLFAGLVWGGPYAMSSSWSDDERKSNG